MSDGVPYTRADTDDAVRSGSFLLVLRVGQYALVFLGGLVIARALGPDGRAQYALPLNLVAVAWTALHLSIEHGISRMLGRREMTVQDAAQAGMAAGLVLGLATTACALAVGLATRDSLLGSTSVVAVVIAAATALPMTLQAYVVAVVLRLGRVRVYGYSQLATAVVQAALLLALALPGHLTPEAVLGINLLITVAALAAMLVTQRRELGRAALRPAFGPALRTLVRVSTRLHVSSIGSYLNLRIDIVLVGALVSLTQAGLYTLAAMLVEVITVGASTVGLAALKRQTELDDEDAARFTFDFTRQTATLALGLAIVAAVSAYPLIVTAYGQEWEGSVLPFVVLCAGSVGLAVERPVRTLLMRIGSARDLAVAAFGAALVNIALNLALIPAIGIVGAAIASAVSYWVAAASMLWLARRETAHGAREILALPRRDDIAVRWALAVVRRGRR